MTVLQKIFCFLFDGTLPSSQITRKGLFIFTVLGCWILTIDNIMVDLVALFGLFALFIAAFRDDKYGIDNRKV